MLPARSQSAKELVTSAMLVSFGDGGGLQADPLQRVRILHRPSPLCAAAIEK